MKKVYTMELCEGRHPSPAKEGIFPKSIEENNFRQDLLVRRVEERIPSDCERLELFTSGFAMGLLAVVKVCAARGINLIAYNWSARYRMYVKQEIF